MRCKFGLNMHLCNKQKICDCADEQTVALCSPLGGNKDFQFCVDACKLSRQSTAIKKKKNSIMTETLFHMMTQSSKNVSFQSSWGARVGPGIQEATVSIHLCKVIRHFYKNTFIAILMLKDFQ